MHLKLRTKKMLRNNTQVEQKNWFFRRFISNLISEFLLCKHSQGPSSIFCKETEKTHCSISREVLNPKPTGKRKTLIEGPLQRSFQNDTLQEFEKNEIIDGIQEWSSSLAMKNCFYKNYKQGTKNNTFTSIIRHPLTTNIKNVSYTPKSICNLT